MHHHLCDNGEIYLEEVKVVTNYTKHLFGHMHMDHAINDRDICLYEKIMRIL